MIDVVKAVLCTKCGARLKVKATASRVKCGKCGNSFEVATATADVATDRTANGHSPRFTVPPSPSGSKTSSNSKPEIKEAITQLGFFAYVWRSYYHTHSSVPFVLAVIFGLLLMPVLSFLKPKIGVEFIIGAGLIAPAMSILLFGVLVVIASSHYLFGKQRTIAEDQRSWLSAFICFVTFLSPSLGMVATVEFFSPPDGLFVKLVPQFKAEQQRLFGEVTNEFDAESGGAGADSVNDGRGEPVPKKKAEDIVEENADSQGILADVIKKIDAERELTAMLKEELAGLPMLLTASIDGEPQFDKMTSEVKVEIVVRVNREAYAAYVERLEQFLGKVAVAKDSTTLDAKVHKSGSFRWYLSDNNHALRGPSLSSTSQWCIWVNHAANEDDTILNWNCYVVECDPSNMVRALEMPNAQDAFLADAYSKRDARSRVAQRASNSQTIVTLSAFDASGAVVKEAEMELFCGQIATYGTRTEPVGVLPLLRHVMLRDLKGEVADIGDQYQYTVSDSFIKQKNQTDQRYRRMINLFVSPYALSAKSTRDGFWVGYYPQQRITQRLEVTLEELKRIAKFQCEVELKSATGKASKGK